MKLLFYGLLTLLLSHTGFANEPCNVLVVVGMKDEQAIATGPNTEVVVGTANAARLNERLQTININSIKAVFSFGVAGALDTSIKPGDLFISQQVLSQQVLSQLDTDTPHAVEVSWLVDPSLLLAASLYATKADIPVRKGIFLGTNTEARDQTPDAIANLHALTDADLIDNETHIAAQFASEHGLPFLSIRAVSDSAHHPLPPAALLPLDPEDGGPDVWAIAKSILSNPLQVPGLIRTARDYHKALRALQAFRNTIGFQKLAATNGACSLI